MRPKLWTFTNVILEIWLEQQQAGSAQLLLWGPPRSFIVDCESVCVHICYLCVYSVYKFNLVSLWKPLPPRFFQFFLNKPSTYVFTQSACFKRVLSFWRWLICLSIHFDSRLRIIFRGHTADVWKDKWLAGKTVWLWKDRKFMAAFFTASVADYLLNIWSFLTWRMHFLLNL